MSDGHFHTSNGVERSAVKGSEESAEETIVESVPMQFYFSKDDSDILSTTTPVFSTKANTMGASAAMTETRYMFGRSQKATLSDKPEEPQKAEPLPRRIRGMERMASKPTAKGSGPGRLQQVPANSASSVCQSTDSMMSTAATLSKPDNSSRSEKDVAVAEKQFLKSSRIRTSTASEQQLHSQPEDGRHTVQRSPEARETRTTLGEASRSVKTELSPKVRHVAPSNVRNESTDLLWGGLTSPGQPFQSSTERPQIHSQLQPQQSQFHQQNFSNVPPQSFATQSFPAQSFPPQNFSLNLPPANFHSQLQFSRGQSSRAFSPRVQSPPRAQSPPRGLVFPGQFVLGDHPKPVVDATALCWRDPLNGYAGAPSPDRHMQVNAGGRISPTVDRYAVNHLSLNRSSSPIPAWHAQSEGQHIKMPSPTEQRSTSPGRCPQVASNFHVLPPGNRLQGRAILLAGQHSPRGFAGLHSEASFNAPMIRPQVQFTPCASHADLEASRPIHFGEGIFMI